MGTKIAVKIKADALRVLVLTLQGKSATARLRQMVASGASKAGTPTFTAQSLPHLKAYRNSSVHLKSQTYPLPPPKLTGFFPLHTFALGASSACVSFRWAGGSHLACPSAGFILQAGSGHLLCCGGAPPISSGLGSFLCFLLTLE